MRSVRKALTALRDLYRLELDDAELVRGQFHAILEHIPLLKLVLALNAATLSFVMRDVEQHWLTRVAPGILGVLAVARAIWWFRLRGAEFDIERIRGLIRTTTRIAYGLAAVYTTWVILLFPHADTVQRGHLLFFLALTQVSSIVCLMPVRAAALGVATIGMLPFTVYFALADHGAMWVEAMSLGIVGAGLMALLVRYNRFLADLVHSQHDLRARQAESERLVRENRRIALTDALSGLPNRRAVVAWLETCDELLAKGTARIAVMFIDLDGFKQVNDDYGHELGDALIRAVSAELAEIAPAGAMLARIGGDEFGILFECDDAAAVARQTGRDFLARLAVPLDIAGHHIQVGASIGIAVDDEPGLDPHELLRRADAAMYRVKGAGKAGVVTYEASIDQGRDWRIRVKGEIRRGLENDEFGVVYQPLVDARSGHVVAVEALARWPGRDDGPLAPDEFITVAETTGLIHPLGLFVLRRACEELRDSPELRLNVNISPAQFRHPGFEAEVVRMLGETRFPPSRLQIEITETYMIEQPERAARAIDAFRAIGIEVALDDFGSGFASLAYLRRFGFSKVKIDKSLLAGLGEDDKAAMVIAGIVHLATGFDMAVTAEGVETERQARLLRLAGCAELQGYLFGRPGPLGDLVAPAVVQAASSRA